MAETFKEITKPTWSNLPVHTLPMLQPECIATPPDTSPSRRSSFTATMLEELEGEEELFQVEDFEPSHRPLPLMTHRQRSLMSPLF
ncbi:hypothetical protein PAXRUDRAFT_835256 [Paxillus rubicundulus Ve08.2h10]|uniref:Uncharacterized protein n=1 Tax=Paxillus rubicundulus Ve08.2h10 TaxID=930991 RepID=A0A0D0D8J6_9AGAM|nr:hypothetical protein PAXRUDRAFT_835256 [Paxillus rubicundulus Ve08.2h10]